MLGARQDGFSGHIIVLQTPMLSSAQRFSIIYHTDGIIYYLRIMSIFTLAGGLGY